MTLKGRSEMAELTMMRRSPLGGMARELMEKAVTGERHVRETEWRFATMVSLRVDPTSPAAGSIEGVLGTGLPRSAGDVTSHGQHSVLWQGPDEWLVVSQMSAEALVLWQVGPDGYRLLPRSSFAEYVARWLLHASQEFASEFRDGGRI
jgi:sarcosine oxidase gamma subunit